MYRLIFCFTVFILLVSSSCFSQHLSELNTGQIVELECVEVSEGVLVAAVMERNPETSKTFIEIYRSINAGVSWSKIEYPFDMALETADPILITTVGGDIYLIFMSIYSDPLQVDLEMFHSVDQGENWERTASPHINNGIADYPQLVIGAENEIYLTYTWFESLDLPSKVIFKKSTDFGLTWVDSMAFSLPDAGVVGPDVSLLEDDEVIVFWGNSLMNQLHAVKSVDGGTTWAEIFSVSNINESDKANITKVYPAPLSDHIMVLSHQPHKDSSPLNYHFSADNGLSWLSGGLANGAYAQGCYDHEGQFHVIYHQLIEDTFRIMYTFWDSESLAFVSPAPLYVKSYDQSQKGEYESFFMSEDGWFHVVFTDWSNGSEAKILVFSPDLVAQKNFDHPKKLKVYPNPVKNKCEIQLTQTCSGEVKVVDYAGKTVLSFYFENSTNIPLNTEKWSKGSYFISIETETKIWVNRILKL